MRDNEPLGIYAELQSNRERYKHTQVLRRYLIDPVEAPNGAYAQPVNPFMRVHHRLAMVGKPQHRKFGNFDRPVWPQAKLGIKLDVVVIAVIIESGIGGDEIFSNHQTYRVMRPRQVAMYMAAGYCPCYSFPQLALLFRRDHTTVIHGVRVVQDRLDEKHEATVDLVNKVHSHLQALVKAA